MIEIIVLYAIGHSFFKLAGEYNKNQWLYGILGAISSYVGMLLMSVLLGIALGLYDPILVQDLTTGTNAFIFGLCMIPLGLLCSYVFYVLLKRSWEKERYNTSSSQESDLLDDIMP